MKYSFFIRIRNTGAIILFCTLFYSCLPPDSYRQGWMFRHERGSSVSEERRIIVNTAKQYLGVRYRNGGMSPRGFDCSGFVKYVYKKTGIILPRSAQKQYYRGNRISYRSIEPGDLVFFRTRGCRVSHVGIYLGNDRFIHAPSTGKNVSIDSMYNNYWKKRYVGSVTYL